MAYYDSVKDDVKNKSSSSSKSDGGSGNFDTLKQNASEETEQKEEDDTPIEVLDEGLDNTRTRKKSRGNSSQTSDSSGGSGFPPTNDNEGSKSVSADTSGLEEKLERIIEQNARMIEILESFGN